MAVLKPIRFVGLALWLVWRGGRGIALRLARADPLAVRGLADSMQQFVWSPLPMLTALAGLVGLIAGVLVARILEIYHAEAALVRTLDQTLVREVLPLLIGTFIAGSVAVEVATRLAAMVLAHEIDTLESLGEDPASHALGPPLVAVIVACPLHLLCGSAAALAGAALPLALGANVASLDLLRLALGDNVLAAMLGGLSRVAVFSLLAFAIGAVNGTGLFRRPLEIGRAARKAFAWGLLATFAADALWVALG